MKNKYIVALLTAIIIITSLPFAGIVALNVSATSSLGTLAECRADTKTETITVGGSIKHSVLVANREGKIAVYRFAPWENYERGIKTAVPLAVMDMTIRFEFKLSCKTALQRMSLYAVAVIDVDGVATLIDEPRYADHTTSDTSAAGFKAVLTEDIATASASHPGSAIVDVYLDRLHNGNKSGYIYNVDGKMFYFDRDEVKELDKKVLTYTASGCNVYFRFLISPYASGLDFCTGGNTWATNKCIVVRDADSLNALYAFTSFLVSRYDGTEYGKLNGIIVGKGVDIPVLYNYAQLISEDYDDVYARSLTIIGLAAAESAGDSKISVIVPVSDIIVDGESVNASDFLYSVSEYLAIHTKLGFTVMCESRHNPYKLTDSDFSTEIIPEETTVDYTQDTKETSSEISPETSSDVTFLPDDTTGSVADTTYPEFEETGSPAESSKPVMNQNSDGFFCTDNIGIFITFFNKLKKSYTSVNDGFAWCWYPTEDSSESALGVCYAYNYMKLATIGADFYAVSFENEVSEKFSSISHLFKYIDTEVNFRETEYARAALGISSWNELISGCREGTGVYNKLYASEFNGDGGNYTGSLTYLDYSKGSGSAGWFEGVYCDSLGIKLVDGKTSLNAHMQLSQAGIKQAEIGYILKRSEPLLIADAMSFEVKCGENDGSLYEMTVYIYGDKGTIVSGGVISGGKETTVSVDVSGHDKTVAVGSIKIAVKRITGSGDCVLSLSRVTIDSNSHSAEELANEFDDIRDYLRADAEPENRNDFRIIIFFVVILLSVGLVAIFIAFGNDRRRSSETEVK